MAEITRLPVAATPEPWGGFFPSEIKERPDPEQYIVDNIVPRETVVLLAGAPKAAKSQLLMQLLTSVALGVPWIGVHVDPVKCLGFFCEDNARRLQLRQCIINDAYGFDLAQLEDKLELNPRDGLSTELIHFERDSDRPIFTLLWQTLWRDAAENGVQLFVFDTAANMLGGDRSIYNQSRVKVFVRELTKQVTRLRGAAILTLHTNKLDPTGYGGPTQWHGSVRAAMNIAIPIDKDNRVMRGERILTDLGGNYGSFEPIHMEFRNGVLEAVDNPSLPGRPKTLDEKLDFKYRILSFMQRIVRRGMIIPIDDSSPDSLPKRVRRSQPGTAINDIIDAQEQLLNSAQAVLVAVNGKCMIRPKDWAYPEEGPWNGKSST